MWESTDFKILVIQSVIIWGTLLAAIIMLSKYKGERGESQGEAAKSKKKGSAKGDSPDANKKFALSFITAEEINAMSLEMLQSVPAEQMEQLPHDKREIVRKRINDLMQEERKKRNK
jgi:hypothetical protein